MRYAIKINPRASPSLELDCVQVSIHPCVLGWLHPQGTKSRNRFASIGAWTDATSRDGSVVTELFSPLRGAGGKKFLKGKTHKASMVSRGSVSMLIPILQTLYGLIGGYLVKVLRYNFSYSFSNSFCSSIFSRACMRSNHFLSSVRSLVGALFLEIIF